MRGCLKVFGILAFLFIGGFVAFAVLAVVVSDIKPNARPNAAAKAANAEKDAKDKADGVEIMKKAYVVGRTMARSGAVKPNAAQVDALSRAAQAQAGDTRSRTWFKQYFEPGFWEGWKAK
jgi:hypothetical protein